MQRRAAHTLLIMLRVAVTAAVLWLLFGYYGVGRIWSSVGRLDAGWLAVALGLTLAQVFILAWRWQLFCRVLSGVAPRLSVLVSAIGRSMLVGQLLPATVGADAIRAGALAKAAGTAVAIRSVVCDRLLGFLALALMVAAELPLVARQSGASTAVANLALAALALVVGFLALLALRRWLPLVPLLGRPAAIIAEDLRRALARPSGRLGFALGFAGHATSALIFVALLCSVDAGASPAAGALVILPALLVLAVPISLGGWGVREGAVASGFALLGADPAPAIAASILFGLTGPVGGAAIELLGLASHAAGVRRGPASTRLAD